MKGYIESFVLYEHNIVQFLVNGQIGVDLSVQVTNSKKFESV